MDEKKQKMLDRIAKMMVKAKNKETPEEKTAYEMAVNLMVKYQIEETDLVFANVDTSEVYNDEEGLEILTDEYGKKDWVSYLATALAETFHCKPYINTYRGTIHFIGSAADIETCCYFAMVIHNYVESKAFEYAPDRVRKRRTFGIGAYMSIKERLNAMKEKMEKSVREAYSGSTDLMVIKDSLVEQEYDKYSKAVKMKPAKKSKAQHTDQDALRRGVKAGKEVPLHTALGD